MRLAARLALAAMVIAMLAAQAADARVIRTVAPASELVEGPVLAGARVAWEERRCPGQPKCGFDVSARYLIRAAGPRGTVTLNRGRTRSAPGGENAFFSSVSFDLSARRFALARSVVSVLSEEETGEAKLSVGGRDGGGLRQLLACKRAFAVDNPYALSSDLIAYDPNPCDELPRLAVRNLATGGTRDIEFGPPGETLSAVAIAGRYVAHLRGATVALHDRVTGAELFSAALPQGTAHGIDVARDGRLAVSVGSPLLAGRTCWQSRLWVLRAGGDVLEEQAARPCWDARLTATGVAYLRGGRRPTALVHADTAGATRAIVRFGERPAWQDFDAQGARAAYGVRCEGRMLIRVVTLGASHPACG